MKKKLLMIETYIILLIMSIFLVFLYFLLFIYDLSLYDYVLYGLLCILLILTTKIGLVKGLLLAISIIFIYGSIIFFQIISGSIVIWRINYGILVGYTLCPLWLGLIHDSIDMIHRDYHHYITHSEKIVNVDEITGYGTGREFFKDLEAEMAKARRYKAPLSIGILEVQFYYEILTILGKEEMDQVFKLVTESLNHAIRIEDMKYRIEKNLIALIFPHTDLVGAEITRKRIKQTLHTIQLERENISKEVTIEVKIGLLEYEDGITNPLVFKRDAMKEIEYDV